ncbi:hypothetical protein C3B59_01170 [Cryobacterium zongtaii]|uniref:Uncharacterized protein n=1 Tax=Cryobacterium zongtaii TaxID=1259217 RepID=A0A2S3ZPU1_9MICO|nr:hypothetical protein C3B59_01170 [Cryobacterium zongtaii]
MCEGESLYLTHEDGVPLTDEEVARGTQGVQFYCDSNSGDARDSAARGVGYGQYIRNATSSSVVNCACGNYRTFSVDVNASGVPYDGRNANNLNVIYRVTPGNGAWQYGPSIPITTYGTLATQSGTMTTFSYVTAIASVYRAGTLLENIQSSAP